MGYKAVKIEVNNAMLGTHSSKMKSLTTVHKSKLILPPQKQFSEINKPKIYVMGDVKQSVTRLFWSLNLLLPEAFIIFS